MKMKANPCLFRFLLFPAFVLAFALLSCGKKWKETTTGTFSFSINTNATSSGNVKFVGGRIRLAEVHFQGTRKKGDDVEFTNAPSSIVDFTNGTVNPPIVYDIPQGTYDNMKVDIRLESQDLANPSIFLEGIFVNGPNDSTPVYFSYIPSQIYSLQARSSSGGNEIVLVEDVPASFDIFFDPAYWFDAIPPGQFVSASHQNVNGVPSIVIDANSNGNLYQQVLDRIAESTRITVH